MRIIAGAHRGRRIQAPPGKGTRPMLDRVREALFSTLAPWLPEAHVLDLFAGSGSLGLEALSRGARSARFVERDPDTARLLADNLALLGEEARGEVHTGDALAPGGWGGRAPDVVLFDPPYALLDEPGSRANLLDAIRELLLERAGPEAVLVFHVPRGALDLSEVGEGIIGRSRDYGTNTLWYLQAKQG